MKQIKNGFPEELFLTEECFIYNSSTDKIIKPYKDHCFKIKLRNSQTKTISQKSLYKLVYNKTFCIDNTESIKGQQWKQIDDSDYYVSSLGRIKSCKRNNAIILKQSLNRQKNGYLKVKLSFKGKTKNFFVHCLVGKYFLSKPSSEQSEQSYQLHHKDLNRLNNAAYNLQWLTKKQHQKIHANIENQ